MHEATLRTGVPRAPRGLRTTAQSASYRSAFPAAVNMMAFDANKYLQTWENGWKHRDIGPIMADVADNVEFRDTLSPTPTRGRDAYRQNYEAYFKAFELERFEALAVVHSGDIVAYYLRAHSRHVGEFPLPDGRKLAGTGKRVVLELADFVWVKNGKIVRDESVFDTAALLSQLTS